MATEAPSTDEVRCSHHPNTFTRLRCSRCGKPICPQCSVRTPVGLRCPECAGVRGLPTYPTGLDALVKAAGIGLVLAIAIGYIWSRYPDWGFYLAWSSDSALRNRWPGPPKANAGSIFKCSALRLSLLPWC